MIEHWTLLVELTYVIYVYLCSHVVEIDNFTCYPICTTCISNLKDQHSNIKSFCKCLNLE
jgi:hypothetical protein